MSARVAAVVVTYNSADHIEALLDSIPAAAGGLEVRVVVVDNASTDRTRAIVSDRSDCELIEAPNLGYAAGINRGIDRVEDDRQVLVLNPDVVLAPDSIAALSARAAGDVGIVAPLVTNADGSLHHSLRRDPTVLRTLGLTRTGRPSLAEYVEDPSAYTTAGPVDWALGAVLLVSVDCRHRVGRWDESFFMYSEETDYSLRARDVGYATWFEPRARAMHVGGGSGQSPQTHAMQIVNRVRLYRRRHSRLPSAAFMALTMLRELVWLPRSGAKSRAAIAALARPSRRPPQLGASRSVIPR